VTGGMITGTHGDTQSSNVSCDRR